MESSFSLIKCKAVTDLLYITEVAPPYCISHESYEEYVISLSDISGLRLFLCIKDLDIYIHPLKLNLSDYIFLRKKPTPSIIKLLNTFRVDDIFCHCISHQKLISATNAITETLKSQSTT